MKCVRARPSFLESRGTCVEFGRAGTFFQFSFGNDRLEKKGCFVRCFFCFRVRIVGSSCLRNQLLISGSRVFCGGLEVFVVFGGYKLPTIFEAMRLQSFRLAMRLQPGRFLLVVFRLESG